MQITVEVPDELAATVDEFFPDGYATEWLRSQFGFELARRAQNQVRVAAQQQVEQAERQAGSAILEAMGLLPDPARRATAAERRAAVEARATLDNG